MHKVHLFAAGKKNYALAVQMRLDEGPQDIELVDILDRHVVLLQPGWRRELGVLVHCNVLYFRGRKDTLGQCSVRMFVCVFVLVCG